jgi:hypothetical protein
MDKEKKSEYNRRYYESHKDEILTARKLSDKKSVAADPVSHRKASREYYHRKKATETPEEREARNARRRERYKSNKATPETLG